MTSSLPKEVLAERLAALSNPFSTGGGGVDFEHRVQATFLLALLISDFSPLLNLPVTSVDFQVKRLNWDIDDLKVTASTIDGEEKLLCQIKHGIDIGNNSTFTEIVVAAWSDFNNPEFNKDTDKIVLITGLTKGADVLRFIYEQAQVSIDAKDFICRVDTLPYSSKKKSKTLNIIRTVITESANKEITDEELWDFCKVFTVLVFDMAYESSINQCLVRSLINSNIKNKTDFVWEKLIECAGKYDKTGAHITRENLPKEICNLFGFTEKFAPQIYLPIDPDFSDGEFWSKLSIIGSWNERNAKDIQLIEEFLDMPYLEIQKKIQTESLTPKSKISLTDGIWTVANRQLIITTFAKCLFDNHITKLFEYSTTVYSEIDIRIQENGEYNTTISEDDAFSFSKELRNRMINGLAMLNTLVPSCTSCTDNFIDSQAQRFVRKILNNADARIWISLDSILMTMAEVHPSEYLSCLDFTVLNTPHIIEALFPNKTTSPLFSRNPICPVLWSLECLAWNEKYFIQCIQILGELENLNYDRTNFANTPIRSIINIILPWYPQTLATPEKQKNAVKVLLVEVPSIAWKVIISLLPNSTSSTAGTYKPNYLHLDLPKEIDVPTQDIQELYRYYSSLAVKLAKEDYSKLYDLLPCLKYMDKTTIKEYLEYVIQGSNSWNDSIKYPIWNSFSDQKMNVIRNFATTADKAIMELLDLAICKLTPTDIRQKYRRIYDSEFTFFLQDDNFSKNREDTLKQQNNAVQEIYSDYGIDDVIKFAKDVNKVTLVAHNLGKFLKCSDFQNLLTSCFENNLEQNFFSSILNGFVFSNGYNSLLELNFNDYPPEYTAWVLSCVSIHNNIFEIAEKILKENVNLYWNQLIIPTYFPEESINSHFVWEKLIENNRIVAAINLFHFASCSQVPAEEIQIALIKALSTEYSERLEPDAVRNLIARLQNDVSPDFEKISEIEFYYLPWLDEYSNVKPKALRYRIANEPDYFCKLIEMMYKKKNSDSDECTLPESYSNRLYSLLFKFSVVPGTDWENNYHEDIFEKWIQYTQKWGQENDYIEVVLHTIGTGLSYAQKQDNGLDYDFIIKELNKANNEKMRHGYRLGVINQRGVHWVDPEGKPEYELAKKYQRLADKAESLGYARYATTLHNISTNYIKEAEYNIKIHLKEQQITNSESN